MQVGCDLVDVGRFSAAMRRRDGMRRRVFSPTELADVRRGGVDEGSAVELERLAARFAVKEATRKALRDLRLGFTAVEVRRGPGGAPLLYVDGEPSDLVVSMSHDAGMAMAVVVDPGSGSTAPDGTGPGIAGIRADRAADDPADAKPPG